MISRSSDRPSDSARADPSDRHAQRGRNLRELVVADRQDRPCGAGATRGIGVSRGSARQRGLDLLDVAGDSFGELELGAHRSAALEHARERTAQRVQALASPRDDRDHRHSERGLERGHVDLDPCGSGLVHHVERDDRGDTGLEHLVREVEMPLQRARIAHHHDRCGSAPRPWKDRVDRDLLLGRSRGQAVGSRDVDQIDADSAVELDPAHASIDGDAGIVSGPRARAGERIEERRLAGIGVAGEQDHASRAHDLSSGALA